MDTSQMIFPTDIIIEIFNHLKFYSIFRALNRACNKALISWDGWDSLIARGISVKIGCICIQWFKKGVLYREGDLPSMEWIGGTKKWTEDRQGALHRIDLPAIEYADGGKEWYWHGRLHRGHDLPAYESAIGTRIWYKYGKIHRNQKELPAYIGADGIKEWWIEGERVAPKQ